MSNKNSNLLSPTEIFDIYGIPIFNEVERKKYYTLNKAETIELKSYKSITDGIYFLVSLAFFKVKHSFIEFDYRDISEEIEYLVNLYFTDSFSEKNLLSSIKLPTKYVQSRIRSKILNLCKYQRFSGSVKKVIQNELSAISSRNPRQRQLCKEFLNLCTKHRVMIPGYTTMQDVVSNTWNAENKRISLAYIRYTSKVERFTILSLLEKTDHLHHIISIKQDMKGFKTHDIWSELEKREILKPIFDIALLLIPKLFLPRVTIEYYASLINYYSGPGLKQLKPEMIGLYLICYVYTRYQMLNDNLLEAFKKKTNDYQNKAKEYAKAESLKHLDILKETRERMSGLLVTIKNDPDPTVILKEKIYSHVPEDELLIAARMLVDDNFNKDLLFWRYIDNEEDSIKLYLRKLFLKIDFNVTNNEALKNVVDYFKGRLEAEVLSNDNPIEIFKKLFTKSDHEYIFADDKIIYNRCEFLLYMKMMYQLSANNITLQHSIKHKKVEDEIFKEQKWKKEKRPILKSLGFSKLSSPIKITLGVKNHELTSLYKAVNKSVADGENEYIIIKKNNKGEDVWRLRPVEALGDTDVSLFAEVPQRSIVDIIRFVNQKTEFYRLFDPLLPRAFKSSANIDAIMAAVLANAIRVGVKKMADISDLNSSLLLRAEASYIRVDILLAIIDKINNETAKLPIYKEWYINSILHGSLDGLKLGASKRNAKARHSKKYFNDGVGVAGYNEIVNFLSVAGRIIGSNEYEGHYTFEMVYNQNSSEIKPKHISTDKHGVNALNFALFDLVDLVFAPRIPKPHKETLWGFGSAKDYEVMLIKPTHFIDEELLCREWDNIQRLVASILTGETSPSVIIRKLSSKNYTSDTKKAFVQYNHIVRSQFILLYIHDYEFRSAIINALNRGELYNNLYRSIAILNNGELKGKSEIEMEIWNQCTRLIAAIMHYYNTYILNSFYVNTKDKKEKAFLAKKSPTSWGHINLLGYYQFCNGLDDKSAPKLIENWIQGFDWQKNTIYVEKNNENIRATEPRPKSTRRLKADK